MPILYEGSMNSRKRKLSRLLLNLRVHYQLYLMLLPGFVGFLLFGYLPLLGQVMAFQDFDLLGGLFDSKWVGLRWFIEFFHDPYFSRLVRNTLVLGVYSLALGFPMPVILAVLLNEVRFYGFKRFVQSISFLPYFISITVVVSIIWMLFGTGGMIARVLAGFAGERVNILGNPSWFRPLYIGSEIWQYTGYYAIVYLAALAAIDPMLYEAAIVDGANRLQRIWYITLPGLRPTMTILLILSMGRLVDVWFERVFLLYSPATYVTADVIETYVYRRGMINFDFSYATAVGMVQSLLVMFLVVATNTILKMVRSETTLW